MLMNKSAYLGLSILELRKLSIGEFWYDYVKPKYGEKTKLGFIVYIKTNDIYKDIAEDVGYRFHTSNFELNRPVPKEKIKN